MQKKLLVAVIVISFLFICGSFCSFEKEEFLTEGAFILESQEGLVLLYDNVLEKNFFHNPIQLMDHKKYKVIEFINGQVNAEYSFFEDDSVKRIDLKKNKFSIEKKEMYGDDKVLSRSVLVCEVDSVLCRGVVENFFYENHKIKKYILVLRDYPKKTEEVLDEQEFEYDERGLFSKKKRRYKSFLNYASISEIINGAYERSSGYVSFVTQNKYDSFSNLIDSSVYSISNELVEKNRYRYENDELWKEVIGPDGTQLYQVVTKNDQNKKTVNLVGRKNDEKMLIDFNSNMDTVLIKFEAKCGFDCVARKTITFNKFNKRENELFEAEISLMNFLKFASMTSSVAYKYDEDGKIRSIVEMKEYRKYLIPSLYFFVEDQIKTEYYYKYM